MRVLITGSDRGQLYWELNRTVPENATLVMPSSKLDITDSDAVRSTVEQLQPSVIINAAAYTAVDNAEKEHENAFAVNATALGTLADAAKSVNARVLHVSTDFVFGSVPATPIKCDATTNPISVYGKSKLAGEQLLLERWAENSLVVRTAWVYSSHGNNFVKTMLRLMNERGEVGVIADQIGCPTWANSLANALWRAADVPHCGVLHWTDAGAASWYDFAQAIMEEGLDAGLLDKPAKVNPLTTDQYPTPAARPNYSLLDLTETWEALDIQARHWRVELRNMMRELL